jgi:vacuolar-type H+-ATPase subunit I/STV1
MSEDRDILLVKSVAKDIIEHIWKTEFYNDAEDYILYRDSKTKKNPRPEKEIEEIDSELSRLKNDLIDEIVEDLTGSGINSMEDITKSFEKVKEICYKRFGKYRRQLWDVTKSELSFEKVRN